MDFDRIQKGFRAREELCFEFSFAFFPDSRMVIGNLIARDNALPDRKIEQNPIKSRLSGCKPELAMTQNQMLRRKPEGNWSYQYFSGIEGVQGKACDDCSGGIAMG